MRAGKWLVGCVLFLPVFFGLGCSHASTPGKDPFKVHEVVCQNSTASCYTRATAVCDGDYKVLNKIVLIRNDNVHESFREYHYRIICE